MKRLWSKLKVNSLLLPIQHKLASWIIRPSRVFSKYSSLGCQCESRFAAVIGAMPDITSARTLEKNSIPLLSLRGRFASGAKWMPCWCGSWIASVALSDTWSMPFAELEAMGVAFISLRDNLDLSTPSGRLMFQIIGAMAEFERAVDTARVAELRGQGWSWAQIAREMELGLATVRRAVQKPSTPNQ